MEQPTVKINGKDHGLVMVLEYVPDPNVRAKDMQTITLALTTPERCKQLHSLLRRALNTMDSEEAPEWAVGLMDIWEGTPAPMKPQNRPVHQA